MVTGDAMQSAEAEKQSVILSRYEPHMNPVYEPHH